MQQCNKNDCLDFDIKAANCHNQNIYLSIFLLHVILFKLDLP